MDSRTTSAPTASPRPWRVEARDGFEFPIIVDAEGLPVAQVVGPAGPRTARVALAHQLAAAPDLLAACEAMVRRCRGQMPDPRYPAWHDTCCEAARAAIAAAKGTPPLSPPPAAARTHGAPPRHHAPRE
jgi:hypothetical protein